MGSCLPVARVHQGGKSTDTACQCIPPSLLLLPDLPDTRRGGSNRVFVVQQGGAIRVFPNDSLASSSRLFLSLAQRISSPSGEEGLLGLAFHPQYATNGTFYVNYTAPSPLRTVISRFHVSADPDRADSLSEYIILQINQPYSNHNGGMIAFGPDGYLYIGMGDGGSGGDPQGNGQNRATLLGKMLRIDVNDTTATTRYRIPSDNPYAGNTSGYREEIWAHGLRNPWRFSFDFPTGDLWCGDVGQNLREEVDLITRGGNYGWKTMEGFACYSPSVGCDQTGLVLPVKEYLHNVGCSITGGYVYRGSMRPELRGAYIYGDYCNRQVWMLRREGGVITADAQLTTAASTISSFGVDERNELYVLGHGNGRIYRFNRSTTSFEPPPGNRPEEYEISSAYPNPFNPSTRWNVTLPALSRVTLEVFDLLGRSVAGVREWTLGRGTHAIALQDPALSSGSYLCQIRALPVGGGKGLSATRRIVLLR